MHLSNSDFSKYEVNTTVATLIVEETQKGESHSHQEETSLNEHFSFQ